MGIIMAKVKLQQERQVASTRVKLLYIREQLKEETMPRLMQELIEED